MTIAIRGLHRELGLTDSQTLQMYRLMLLTRAISQKSWALVRQGKAHFTMMQDGNEAASVGSAFALRPGVDFILPYARDVGAALAVGMTSRELMLNLLSRAEDPNSGGRQMPFHLSSRRLRIVSLSSPVALVVPRAAGLALASKLQGRDEVAVAYIGDGAASKGDTHEGMNFAAVFKAPMVVLCSNNGWAISVPSWRQAAIEDLSVRALGYGMAGVTVDGCDALEVYRVTKEAVERGRRGEGPTFIEAKTVRLVAHTSSDDQLRYRSKEDIEADRARDPVANMRRYVLEAELLGEAEEARLHEEVEAGVEEAVTWAEGRPLPEPSSALNRVYAEPDAAAASFGGLNGLKQAA